jgi:hypothetical protein
MSPYDDISHMVERAHQRVLHDQQYLQERNKGHESKKEHRIIEIIKQVIIEQVGHLKLDLIQIIRNMLPF